MALNTVLRFNIQTALVEYHFTIFLSSNVFELKVYSIKFNGVFCIFHNFRNVPHYQQPLVPVKLDLVRNAKVSVECRAWAKGLDFNTKEGYGYIKFDIQAQS